MAGGITAKPNLDLLESVAHTLKSLKGCWIIGGDWNCTPAQLLATGWPAKVGGIIKAPAAATCNDSTYDYFVVARELDSAVMGVHVIGDAGLTPHSPSRLIFKGGPRKALVRQVKNPPPLPPILPHGPLNEQSTVLDPLKQAFATIEQNYVELANLTMQTLHGLNGVSQQELQGAASWETGGTLPNRPRQTT